ncbi:MAG: thiol peroxidase [Bacteroidales bacterium]
MKRNTNLVTVGGQPVTLLGKMVKPGIHAKNFLAQTPDFKPLRLSDYQGKVRIISSVYSLDYDVCANQTRRFNLEASKLDQVQIITISCDVPLAIKRFRASEDIEKLVTVSDQKDVDFGIKYGLLMEEYRLLARAVVIIDQYDMVRYVEVVKDITDEPDYEKALAVVKDLLK